uniref:CRAL-TRIO domain-containing protein n=1 Tax=Hanusia phi TaxID=3032 RepID=A0A7S0EI57_9CRYP|mmetsp:Transcript_2503/g.6019  ORF Transcript_2503/g.6019 Transcript_2503/m.6019 type:complete len:417 (+) Transcript_2503:465-1715(+)
MANPNPLVPHQNHAVDFKLENLLSRTWENGMTGQKSIDKMREIIANKGVTIDRESVPEDWEDALLLRFFIGFKKNPQTAAEAVIEMLDWRAKNNINEIRRKIIGGLQPEQFPRYETVRRFYPLLKTGTDTNGSPIMITLTGLIDPAKLVKAVTLEEIRLYIIYEMEHKLIKLSQLTAETGIMFRALEIHDLKGLGMHHLATGPIGMLRKVVREVSANYVEMADKVLILNCPFATVVRGVLRQVVPARSQHKLAVLGTREEYEPILVNHAEKDQYHACLFGGALPEGLEGGEDEMEKWAKVTVPARDKKVLQSTVKAGQTLLWCACPEALDIGLQVKFVAAASSKSEILFESGSERVAALQRGSLQCSEDGTVYMTLDNSFSYMKQKIVSYDFEFLDMRLQGSQSSDELPADSPSDQ